MSMKTYYEIKDMICEELDRQAQKGKINSPSELDVLDKLTHSLKSIATIIAMEEAEDGEYSERGGRGGNSYRYSRRDGGDRGRTNARRDSMGRYSRADGYSMDGGKADMIEQMRMMMNSAPDERTRARYQDMIRDMESM